MGKEEEILALDLYIRHRPHTPVPPNHPDVIELSELLNRLPIHPLEARAEKFRNPNGVSMKTGNFKAIDPGDPGRALGSVSKLDKAIWEEFTSVADIHYLFNTADAIRRNAPVAIALEAQEPHAFQDDPIEGIEEAEEGRILIRIHRSREREPKLVAAKKKEAIKATGRLACEVCEFEFVRAYGEVGTGYIECHHTMPVSQMDPGQKTKLKDLVLVCSNCHSMIHKAKPIESISGLRPKLNRN